MNVSAKQRSALPSLSLSHYLGFAQAYACFKVHEVALGIWTVEDVISDTIITRGCWNKKVVISLVLYKGGPPPSKTLRVLLPLVCSICTSCLYRSNEQHKEQLQQTGARELSMTWCWLLRFMDFASHHLEEIQSRHRVPQQLWIPGKPEMENKVGTHLPLAAA